jgi:small subunit ribosomal protein S1
MAWDRVNRAHDEGLIVNGFVKCRTKGGMIVDVFGIEAFLPGSQIDVKPIRDYDAYVGKTMEFKVVKINQEFKNIVVSHKALIEADIEEQKKEIIGQLEKGQVLEGTVKNITDFGAFIDLGGVDGLLYLSDISWGRINHPSEVLELNEQLNVVVLDFDEEKKRISLGLKQLQRHPWDNLPDLISEEKKVKGNVLIIADYVAFLDIKLGSEGLLHVSEISWSLHPIDPKGYFTLCDMHEAIIVTLNKEERKMSLSIKRLEDDPWQQVEDKYPEGTQHKGKVINLTPYGAFVELEEGIGGLVHISDFSWTKKIKHPSQFTSVGDEMDVVILDIDKENRRLSLGHKQVEEDPWDTFESVFPEGTVHQGTISDIDGKRITITLPYGLEATVKPRDVKQEDGSMPKEGDVLDFKVTRFDQEERKIRISHKKLVEEERKKKVKKKSKKQSKPSQKKRKQTKKKQKKKKSKKKGKYYEKYCFSSNYVRGGACFTACPGTNSEMGRVNGL